MNVDYIDTDKLREIGNNILSETNIFKSNIDFLYDRINNINSKTFEWVGNGANNFIEKFNLDFNYYNDIYVFLREYGNYFIEFSNRIDDSIKKVFYE